MKTGKKLRKKSFINKILDLVRNLRLGNILRIFLIFQNSEAHILINIILIKSECSSLKRTKILGFSIWPILSVQSSKIKLAE